LQKAIYVVSVPTVALRDRINQGSHHTEGQIDRQADIQTEGQAKTQRPDEQQSDITLTPCIYMAPLQGNL